VTRIDLNADMGESFGAWRMGDDAALLDMVTSANVACGFHAGDPDVMAATMRAAVAKGVGLGAHPGFADLQGFGRCRVTLHGDSVANLVRYQVAAAQGMARASGGLLAHVKLHGALANMASEDKALAAVCYRAVADLDPSLIAVAMAATPAEAAAREAGLRVACEIYADRGYAEDGTLLPRSDPGAVIHDPAEAARRVADMVAAGAIVTAASGRRLPTAIHTVCVHGDTPGALAMAAAVRSALRRANFAPAPVSEVLGDAATGPDA